MHMYLIGMGLIGPPVEERGARGASVHMHAGLGDSSISTARRDRGQAKSAQ